MFILVHLMMVRQLEACNNLIRWRKKFPFVCYSHTFLSKNNFCYEVRDPLIKYERRVGQRNREKIMPWLTDEILDLMNQPDEYTTLNHIINRLIREAKEKCTQ